MIKLPFDLFTAGVILALTVPFFAGTIWAVVNASQKDFKGGLGPKAVWIIVASIPFVGFIVYFLFGARRGKIPPIE
jgi:hypothetical protein